MTDQPEPEDGPAGDARDADARDTDARDTDAHWADRKRKQQAQNRFE